MTSHPERAGARSLVLATALMGLAVAACAANAAPTPAPSAAAPTPPPTAAPASVAATQQPMTTPSAAAGPSAAADRVALPVVGRSTLPSWTTTGLRDWKVDDRFYYVGPEPASGLSVWEVTRVPTDPCHSLTKPVTEVSGVEATVKALRAQPGREPTRPLDTTIAGRPAVSWEWAVPAHVVDIGDGDFQGCDRQNNGHLDYVSWVASGGGTPWAQQGGQIDHVWVLDLDGSTLVVDASRSAKATDATRTQLEELVASLEFATR